MPRFEYSKDGKTVTVNGKTMSVSAFRRQYDTEEFKGLTPDRKTGSAPKKVNAPEVKKIDSNPSKPKGTQPEHHVTTGKNVTRNVNGRSARGGVGGINLLGGGLIEQIK